jgi:outer membrane protein OmpA-like peptidoglycan-associated protein
MPRVGFISFSSKDRETVERIRHGLETRNVSCWMSTRDIPPGADFQEAIINALEGSKVMLLVFSANANNSAEVKKEVVLASEYKIPLVPVRIENVLPSGAFRYQLTTRNYLDLFQDWDTNLARLTDQLTHLIAANADASTLSARIANDSAAVELAFWESVRESRNPEELATYIREFPSGRFVALARLRMHQLARALQPSDAGSPERTVHSGGSGTPASRVEPERSESQAPSKPRQPSPPPGRAEGLPHSATQTGRPPGAGSSSTPAESTIAKPGTSKGTKIAWAGCAAAALVIGTVVLNHHGDNGTPDAATSDSTAASAPAAAASDANAAASAATAAASEAAGAASDAAASAAAPASDATAASDASAAASEAVAPPAVVDLRTAVLATKEQQVLDALADKIGQLNLEVVVATGYTDASGTTKENDRLSLRRAQAAKAYLVSRGVEANRIYTEGKGSRDPVGPQNTPDGRRLNNRVEIEVVGTGHDNTGRKITYQDVVHF